MKNLTGIGNDIMKFERNKDKNNLGHIGIGKIYAIKNWLEEMNITRYTILEDMTIDVADNVWLDRKINGQLPEFIKFNNVEGYFCIRKCFLISLKGSPEKCSSFFCKNNNLTSLEYSPKNIKNYFDASDNLLTNLDGLKCKDAIYLNVNVNNNPIPTSEITKYKKEGFRIEKLSR